MKSQIPAQVPLSSGALPEFKSRLAYCRSCTRASRGVLALHELVYAKNGRRRFTCDMTPSFTVD